MEKANQDVKRLKKIIGEFLEIPIMKMRKIYSSMHIILDLNRVPLIQENWRKVQPPAVRMDVTKNGYEESALINWNV